MSRTFFSVFIVLVLFGSANAANHVCLEHQQSRNVIEVQVEIAFSSQDLNTDWLYESLNPELIIGDQQISSIAQETISDPDENKKRRIVFCLTDIPSGATSMSLRIGRRIIEIAVKKVVYETLSFGEVQVKYGTMLENRNYNLTDPDWIIAKNPIWYDDDEQGKLDVVLVNFTNQELSTIDVNLTMKGPLPLCGAPEPKSDPIKVKLGINIEGYPTTESDDPEYDDTTQQVGSFDPGDCNNAPKLLLSIGKIYRTPAQRDYRTRFIFEVDNIVPQENGDNRSEEKFIELLSNPKYLWKWQKTLHFMDDRIYPRDVMVLPP
jgi:hypothetical protein